MKRNHIFVGDVRDRLADIDDASIDCIVTSPPYFGLRDYGHHRQIGNETTVTDWVEELRGVAMRLARVLRPDGSWWLNIGDSYSSHEAQGVAKKGLADSSQRRNGTGCTLVG